MPVDPEPLPDLSTLSDDELLSRIRGLEHEEDSISLRRRVLHGRIDILRAEHVTRLRAQMAAGGSVPTTAEGPVSRSIF